MGRQAPSSFSSQSSWTEDTTAYATTRRVEGVRSCATLRLLGRAAGTLSALSASPLRSTVARGRTSTAAHAGVARVARMVDATRRGVHSSEQVLLTLAIVYE
jgi:hypothetical protein